MSDEENGERASSAAASGVPPAGRPRRWLVRLVGWWFVVAGVAGLFLPFLQGILFLFIGLLLLAREEKWARDLVAHAKRRWPRVGRWVEEAERRVESWLGRLRRR
ncbi:MAG: PGPGW domain-containing protein [Alphaproteobacteria bacterium]